MENALNEVIVARLSADSAYLWTLPMFHCNGWCSRGPSRPSPRQVTMRAEERRPPGQLVRLGELNGLFSASAALPQPAGVGELECQGVVANRRTGLPFWPAMDILHRKPPPPGRSIVSTSPREDGLTSHLVGMSASSSGAVTSIGLTIVMTSSLQLLTIAQGLPSYPRFGENLPTLCGLAVELLTATGSAVTDGDAECDNN